jgi:uncharacterized protein with HEPN domain
MTVETKKLLLDVREAGQSITEIRRIVAFRNRLIHGCDSIDDEVVWGVSEKHLPQLVQEVSALLAAAESGQ